jgi:hypothetical protein
MLTFASSTAQDVIPARLHASDFQRSDSNFYSLTCGSDGRVYFTLCTHSIDHYARMYRYDPNHDALTLLGDMGHITGEAGRKLIPQGKSHTPYFEMEGKLYLATHFGYYAPDTSQERPGEVPAGYHPYPGGHFLEVDMASGAVRDLVRAPEGEGIITCTLDPQRRRLYGLTWPSGLLLYHDIGTPDLRIVGPVSRQGEMGQGDTYMCLCRSFAIAPNIGMLYFTNPDGAILRFDPRDDSVATLPHVSLQRDILGVWDFRKPGHQGYNWRTLVWHRGRQTFIGVHPRSGYLFEFDPSKPGAERLDLIDRICADPLRRDGRFEPFRYGYLSLCLDDVRDVVYYLTADYGLTAEDGRTVENTTHLVTYHLGARRYQDHGRIRLADGRYPTLPQTLALHPGGRLYACPWIEKPHRAKDDPVLQQCDLISFADPLR